MAGISARELRSHFGQRHQRRVTDATAWTKLLSRDVTTDATIARDLERSLAARGVPVRVATLGALLDAIEALGVKREDELTAIEWRIASTGNGRLVVTWEDGAASLIEGKK
jgi:hypothetical protein